MLAALRDCTSIQLRPWLQHQRSRPLCSGKPLKRFEERMSIGTSPGVNERDRKLFDSRDKFRVQLRHAIDGPLSHH